MEVIRASALGHIEVVKIFLDEGANMILSSNRRSTPLIVVSGGSHTEVVGLLLKEGVDIDVTNIIGWTPLNEASKKDILTLVQMSGRQDATNDSMSPMNAH